ncbi:hypothetical protein CEE37_06580 [candidate division LCP-89 bacterium B3_LCP]|uniref:Outer membrane protein beta-barrel domain-containing protein n=1 Tax=candidate division LCP-89 bacterium B3_LCP TaxID=2012998 RepID=A0A532V087_UNCL8|nr:MAG: hypothetical protein CEE37_06580 [candidate division LCP-89 bacterium B3_LCP]
MYYKRLLTILSALLILASVTQAQSVTKIKVGTFNPKNARAGLIVGFTTGQKVDERLDFGFGADLFIRKFSQESQVDTSTTSGGTTTSGIETEIEYSMYALPLMVHLDFNIMPETVLKPYIGIAGGYEILFSHEANYLTGEKQSRFYGGFGWQMMIGAEFPIGHQSALLGEILYNGCVAKRSKGSNEQGLPLHEELNFSGLGFRVGLRF